MAISLDKAFQAVGKNLPGAMVDCTWSKVTGSVYDPGTGTTIETTLNIVFSAIKGEYKISERLAGIQAGDVRLLINPSTVSAVPPVGAIVLLGGVAHEVVDSRDYAGVAYELQMRQK